MNVDQPSPRLLSTQSATVQHLFRPDLASLAATPSTALASIDSNQDFSSAISSLLIPDAQGNVHEEEMQYAIVSHLLSKENPALGTQFRELFGEVVGSGTVSTQTEDAVKIALQALVKTGEITSETAEMINGISFRAAQFDDNLNALYDGRGGPGDSTTALMNFPAAMAKSEKILAAIGSGELAVAPRKLTEPSNQVPTNNAARGGSGGFLWKPVSEADGKLVVLLPPQLTGNVQSAAIHSDIPSSRENLVEQGRFSGDSHNGGRAHFRFSSAGGAYPDGVYIVANLTDGRQVHFQIENTAARDTR